MKKITESQLKDKVSSLREYLKVYENQQVDEWSLLSPSSWFNGRDYGDSTSRDDVRSQDASKNSTAGANMALVQHREQLAPGSVASETGKDGVTYAVDAKGMRTFKIENGKWIAMNPPVPTEQPELMGAPEQAASVTPAPGPTAVKIARFKELLAKAALTPQNDPGMKDFMGEGTTYFLNKLRLIESRQLNEVTLSPEEQKEMDSLYAELGNTESPEPEVAELINQYNALKKADQAAEVTPAKPTGPVTWKQIYDLNKDVIGANPNLIKPGQQLKMPDGTTYPVKPGDNLSKIAKNASGGQGASVTAVPPPTAPTKPTAPELTQTQQNLKNYGMYKPGDELRTPTEIAASAGLADATPNPDAGLEPSDPRHSGYAAWKAQQAPAPQAASITPKKNFKPYPAGSRYDKEDKAKAAAQPATESVGYNELQRIVSLVNYR